MKLLPIGFLIIAAFTASAFYNPQSGRWLSRDPIVEKGGVNLYTFVRNDPAARLDGLGLAEWSFGCSPKTCLCNGLRIPKAAVATGVATWRWQEAGGPNYHIWLTWDMYSADSNAGAWGEINPMIGMRPAAGASLAQYQTPAPKEALIKLSPCEYDFVKLKSCLTANTEQYKGEGQFTGKLCGPFVTDLLEACKKESKGCTSTW